MIILPNLQIRADLLHVCYIGLIGHNGLPEIPLILSGLLGKDVAPVGLIPLKLACSRNFKTLGC